MSAQPSHTASRPTPAEPRPPFALLVMPLRRATDGSAVAFAMVSTGPRGGLLLVAAYDPTRITREAVIVLAAEQYGTPTEVFEAIQAPAATCLLGSSFCIRGGVDHDTCEGPLLAAHVPGFTGPVTTLDTQIADFGRGPVISFAGDSHDAVEITAEQLRTAVGDVRAHLDRMLALADEHDALIAVTPPGD
jgi:hypothetical protein